jgi:hypothetical protein
MKKLSAVLAALAALLSLTACHGDDDDNDRKNYAVIGSWTGQAKGTYVAGYAIDSEAGKAKPTLWINGMAQKVEHPMKIAMFTSVFVSGDDVYTATAETDDGVAYTASLVKNGDRQVLSANASPNSVFVSGGKVYVAGSLKPDTDRSMAVLWTDGAEEMLSSNYSVATGVFVSSSDVYVAGSETIDGVLTATLWKNGAPTRLGDGNADSAAYSLFVSGVDVYVAGVEDTGGVPSAILWKNGNRTVLGASSLAASVHVSGNHVFVAGYETIYGATTTGFRAVLWENGIRRALHADSTGGQALSVAAAGGDAHVAGLLLDFSRWGWLATAWENDQVKILASNFGGGLSIFCKQ